MMNRGISSPPICKPLSAFFLCLVVAGIASRNSKPVPALPEESADVNKPAGYYYEEKTVTVNLPGEKIIPEQFATKQPEQRAKKAFSDKDKANLKNEVLPPPPPEPPSIQPEGKLVTTYVAAPEVIEFTMIDHHKPAQPDATTLARPHPYVPSSSFYYTEIDTTTSKSVIRL